MRVLANPAGLSSHPEERKGPAYEVEIEKDFQRALSRRNEKSRVNKEVTNKTCNICAQKKSSNQGVRMIHPSKYENFHKLIDAMSRGKIPNVKIPLSLDSTDNGLWLCATCRKDFESGKVRISKEGIVLREGKKEGKVWWLGLDRFPTSILLGWLEDHPEVLKIDASKVKQEAKEDEHEDEEDGQANQGDEEGKAREEDGQQDAKEPARRGVKRKPT